MGDFHHTGLSQPSTVAYLANSTPFDQRKNSWWISKTFVELVLVLR
jgi:hypothetical protein